MLTYKQFENIINVSMKQYNEKVSMFSCLIDNVSMSLVLIGCILSILEILFAVEKWLTVSNVLMLIGFAVGIGLEQTIFFLVQIIAFRIVGTFLLGIFCVLLDIPYQGIIIAILEIGLFVCNVKEYQWEKRIKRRKNYCHQCSHNSSTLKDWIFFFLYWFIKYLVSKPSSSYQRHTFNKRK